MASTGQGKVEQIAFEVGRLNGESEAAEARMDAPGTSDEDKRLAATVSNDLGEAILKLSDAASFYRPISPVGVMFQLLIAAHDLDNIASHIPAEKRGRVVNEMLYATRRRLRGSIDFLEAHTGTPLKTIGGGFYILNPEAGALLDTNGTAQPIVAPPPAAIVSASWEHGTARPAQPPFASAEDRLLALTRRYEELDGWLRTVSDIESDTGEAQGATNPGSASSHALRMHSEVISLIVGTRATTIRELGLKARIAFDMQGTEWRDDDDSISPAEEMLRSLVQDIMAVAGVTIMPTPDLSLEKLVGRARAGHWPFEAVSAAIAETQA